MKSRDPMELKKNKALSFSDMVSTLPERCHTDVRGVLPSEPRQREVQSVILDLLKTGEARSP